MNTQCSFRTEFSYFLRVLSFAFLYIACYYMYKLFVQSIIPFRQFIFRRFII